MHKSIFNDTVFRIARQATDLVRPHLPEAQARDAFHEFYLIAQECLTQALAAEALRERRLRPTDGKGT